MVFFKYSIVLAVLANAYGALLPAPYASPVPYASPAPYAVAPAYPGYVHAHPHHAPPPPPPPPPAVYHAAPHHVAPVVPIVSQSYDANPDGAYTFQYESGDGSQRQEQGIPKTNGPEGTGGVAVQGRYAYASPEGPVQVEYIADENGYQPSGSHIHPEIIKAVAAQVAFARSEGPVAYHAAGAPPPVPAAYVRAYAPPPPPPPPPVAVTYAPYPYKA